MDQSPQDKKPYKIIRAGSMEELERKVDDAMKAGYSLTNGGLVIFPVPPNGFMYFREVELSLLAINITTADWNEAVEHVGSVD